MREPGLEPGSLAAQDPKSCASTSSATPAGNIDVQIYHYRELTSARGAPPKPARLWLGFTPNKACPPD